MVVEADNAPEEDAVLGGAFGEDEVAVECYAEVVSIFNFGWVANNIDEYRVFYRRSGLPVNVVGVNLCCCKVREKLDLDLSIYIIVRLRKDPLSRVSLMKNLWITVASHQVYPHIKSS